MRLAAALLLLAGPAGALDLVLPAGATLAHEEISPAASHRLALGPWDGDGVPTRRVEGAVAREAWQVPGGATTLELLAPLRAQLAAQGLTVLFDCEAAACGGFDFRLGVEVLPSPAMFVDLADFRYLAAEGPGEWASLLVSRSAGRGFVQAVRVAAAPPEAGPPGAAPPGPASAGPAPPGDLAARLDADGRVVLEGLAFASGSADLAEGGDAALAALAAWLAADPARRVAIVGHTDALGPLGPNVALSRARAEAVAARLVDAHGADGGRVDAEGMGYLAPVASNGTEAGRRANRRVEAVALPPA